MTRRDIYTNTPEDAAEYERRHGAFYDPDRPSLADVLGTESSELVTVQDGDLMHALIAAQVAYLAAMFTTRPVVGVSFSIDGLTHGAVRVNGLDPTHPFVDHLSAHPMWDVLLVDEIVYVRPATPTGRSPRR